MLMGRLRTLMVNVRIMMGGSRREVSVLLLEQAKPRVDVTIGHLEQPRGAPIAAVNDPVALRQSEYVARLPMDGVVAHLAFAGALHHATDRVGVGAERRRGRAGIEL